MVPYTILQVVDSSVHAAAAVDLIASLPWPVGSQVVLLPASSEALQAQHLWSAAALSRARATLEQRGLRVTCQGTPADGGRRRRSVAQDWQPDLIVMGSNHLRPKDRGQWQGLGEQIIDQSQWPVLVARAPFAGLRRILLAVDGSLASQAAIEALASLALPANAEIYVLHVVTPDPLEALTVPGWPAGARLVPPGLSLRSIAAWDKHQKLERDQQAQAVVADAVASLTSVGLRARGHIDYGDAADLILHHTRTQKIDLTVVGARGLGAVRGWLLGSVSRQLVQKARGSVWVIR